MDGRMRAFLIAVAVLVVVRGVQISDALSRDDVLYWVLETAKLGAIVVGGVVLIAKLTGLENRVRDSERRLDEIARLADEERAKLKLSA